jgi:uridine kinase
MIIGICGGTGSGKTTIARKIVESVGRENVILVEQDSYYRDLADVPLDERRQANFDHPDAINSELLVEHLMDIKNGIPTKIPIYDFATHTRKEEKQHIEPKQVIIIEGILIFALPHVLELIDVKVFIDTPDDIRLLRRIKRDIHERGRTLEQTLIQYEKTIRPMHYEFVEASKSFADIIIPQGEQSEVITNLLSSLIKEKLSKEIQFAAS